MIKQFHTKLINQAIIVTLGLLCSFGIIKLQSLQLKQSSQTNLNQESYLSQEKREAIQLSFLKKMPSFGFDNLIADWTMLRFLQYFGDGKARRQTGYSLSPDFLEVIVERDPLFARAYLIISPASSMFAGRPERTIKLMEKGLEKLSPDIPDAHYVWLYKGTDEILFVDDLKKAQKSYKMSANWAKAAGDKKIFHSSNKTAEFLATNPDISTAQVSAWFMVWINNKDEITRELAQTNIEKLGGKLKIYPDGRVEAIPPQAINL